MLSLAKQRAVSLGLRDVIKFKEGDVETIDLPSSTFKEGDVETIDLPSSTFDAVLCRWGLMFLQILRRVYQIFTDH